VLFCLSCLGFLLVFRCFGWPYRQLCPRFGGAELSLDGYSASYKQFEHEDTHVVDLVVTFHQGGPLVLSCVQ
jgi:hypothetical protein